MRKVYRQRSQVVVEDEAGVRETFDEVIFACNANQTLMLLDRPTLLERYLLSSIRYESELHNHTVAHFDASVLPDNEVAALAARSNHIEQYGARPDNYEITYIMHNQQPWARESDKPCLVTYNPVTPIDGEKVIGRWWFQHIVHDVRHVAWLMHLFRFIQGREGAWHCGAHTLVNSQENLPGQRAGGGPAAGRGIIPLTTPRPGGCSTTTGASCTAGGSGRRGGGKGLPRQSLPPAQGGDRRLRFPGPFPHPTALWWRAAAYSGRRPRRSWPAALRRRRKAGSRRW